MAIYSFRTSNYAQNIYKVGSYSFAMIPDEYVQPVKQYAADHYYINDIDNALTQGWINQSEHDDTLALKDQEDPQYRIVTLSSKASEEV